MNGNRLSCTVSCGVEFLEGISYNYVEIINNIEYLRGVKTQGICRFGKTAGFLKQQLANLKYFFNIYMHNSTTFCIIMLLLASNACSLHFGLHTTISYLVIIKNGLRRFSA